MKRSFRSAAVFAAVFFFLTTIFSLTSCNDNTDDSPRISLDDCFSWTFGTYEDTVEDAQKYEYKKLERMGYKNIMEVAGNEGRYVWLKAEFILPEELKNDDLSMVIPYLHFAEELYLNGKYIDDYGTMGESYSSPEIQEAGYGAHLFDFPEFYLNQDGINTINIKVFSLGAATITDGVFIGTRRDGWKTADNQTFWRSRIYVFLEGGMFICGIFFMMLYFALKRKLSYWRFAMLNFFTIIFFSNFFMTDLPWTGFHGGIPFLWYFKLAKCICFFWLEVEFSLFVFAFLEIKHFWVDTIIRDGTFIASIILVLLTPNYYTLMNLTFPILIICTYNFIAPIALAVWQLRKPEKRYEAMILVIAMIPLLISIYVDFSLKTFSMDIKHLYFSVFGWFAFILIFFVYFCLSYSKIASRLGYLNQNLEKEIKLKTDNLWAANEKLEHDKEISTKDMKMAALVQKSFFHPPLESLKNWDFAVRYEPLSIVSGDLFKFYNDNNTLNGISLFDASGHGVAASLVTMLAENIIQQTYSELIEKGDGSVANALQLINERFIEAKSEIENYLTGILLSMKDNEDGSCTITMANAGHPYPLFYNASDNIVEEMLPTADMPYTGPVGLSGFGVEYAEMSFTMNKGDILFLYTDGITEMSNAQKLDFGIEPIKSILLNHNKNGAEELAKKLITRMEDFIADSPRTDDVTFIVLKRT